jgi:hypothetical protein
MIESATAQAKWMFFSVESYSISEEPGSEFFWGEGHSGEEKTGVECSVRVVELPPLDTGPKKRNGRRRMANDGSSQAGQALSV